MEPTRSKSSVAAAPKVLPELVISTNKSLSVGRACWGLNGRRPAELANGQLCQGLKMSANS
eukprot:9289795-Lingulodinium_polyedra.AAC.1